ncbi:MAG: DUF4116 domain-containing protein [Clostridia bacterium]|nr:DUF4116 domain-containing protein [Clostridia bacterium]
MIFNGKTTEEAINNGLKAFNIPREFVEIKELGQMYTPNGIEYCVDISFNMKTTNNSASNTLSQNEENNDKASELKEVKQQDKNVYLNLKDTIKEFIIELEQTHKASKNTIESYERDMRQFLDYVDLKKENYIEYTKKDVESYLEFLEQLGKKEASRARAVATLKKFYSFLLNKNIITDISIINMKSIHVEKKDNSESKSATNIKILKSFNAKYSSSDSLKICRDKALLEVLGKLELKPTEIVTLKVGDFNFATKRLNVGGKLYELDEECAEAIEKYINDARKYLASNQDETTLFLNTTGEAMTRQGFWKIVKFYAEDVDASEVDYIAEEEIKGNNNGIIISSTTSSSGQLDLFGIAEMPKVEKVNEKAKDAFRAFKDEKTLFEVLSDEKLSCSEMREYILAISTSENINDYDLNSNLTPLIYAYMSGKKELISDLIEVGADINLPDKSTLLTLLHISAANGDADLVEKLILSGANVNAESKLKMTPIMCALAKIIKDDEEQKELSEIDITEQSNKKILEILIKNGADLTIKMPKSEKTIADLMENLNINTDFNNNLDTIENSVNETVESEQEVEVKTEEEEEAPPKTQVFLKLKGKDLYKVLELEVVDNSFTLQRTIEKALEDEDGNINEDITFLAKDKIDIEYADLYRTINSICKELPGIEIYATYTDIDFDPFYFMFYSKPYSTEFTEGYIEPTTAMDFNELSEEDFINYVINNNRNIKSKLNSEELEMLENAINDNAFLNNYTGVYNKELLLEICIFNEWNFNDIAESVRADKKFVLDFIKRASCMVRILEYLPINLSVDREILKQLFLKNGSELENADKITQWDQSLVYYACKNRGGAFEYAHPMLKKDKDYIYELSKTSSVFEYADDSLKSDYDYVYKLLEVDPYAIQYASDELRDNDTLAKRAISKEPSTLWCVSDRLRDDEDTVIYACLLDISALECASERLQNDKEFIELIEKMTGKKFVVEENEEMNKLAEHMAKSTKKGEEALESLRELMKKMGVGD